MHLWNRVSYVPLNWQVLTNGDFGVCVSTDIYMWCTSYIGDPLSQLPASSPGFPSISRDQIPQISIKRDKNARKRTGSFYCTGCIHRLQPTAPAEAGHPTTQHVHRIYRAHIVTQSTDPKSMRPNIRMQCAAEHSPLHKYTYRCLRPQIYRHT
jgi:hypothetical protein